MPVTAKRHFDEDISRARNICSLARNVVAGTDSLLETDLYRSSWMFAVGALDAYFCDAYTDVLARLLRAKTEEPGITVKALTGVLIPIEVVLDQHAMRENWKWRMSARDLMSNKNILDLDVAKSYLNKMVEGPILVNDKLILSWGGDSKSARWFGEQRTKIGPYNQKLLSVDTITGSLLVLSATAATTGLPADVTARNDAVGNLAAAKAALKVGKPNFDLIRKSVTDRFDEICDRRHECIHNCDRPKVRPQPITHGSVTKVIDDVEWLIHNVDAWLETGFKAYIVKEGFNSVTRNKIGCS